MTGLAAGFKCGGGQALYGKAPKVIRQLLSAKRLGTETVGLPRLAELAPGANGAAAATFVVHGLDSGGAGLHGQLQSQCIKHA